MGHGSRLGWRTALKPYCEHLRGMPLLLKNIFTRSVLTPKL